MKHDALSMTLLLDYYGELLTEKQREYFDQYYNQDLSLAEIAENEGISRQGVHDALARTEAILKNFEAKTGFVARDKRRKDAIGRIRRAAERLAAIPAAQDDAREILSAADFMEE